MTRITYTSVLSHPMSLGEVIQTLSPQYAVEKCGNPVEGLRLPPCTSAPLLVAEKYQDQGNVATYAALASELERVYPGDLFAASLIPGALFEASMSRDKSGLFFFTLVDVSVPDGRAVSLEIRVNGKNNYEAALRTLKTLQSGDLPQKVPDARNSVTDKRLLQKLCTFLEK